MKAPLRKMTGLFYKEYPKNLIFGRKYFDMKKSVEIKKRKSIVLPTNKPLSQLELAHELEKAENGNFITVQKGMKDFEQWLQLREIN